jgi:hypothetical protein
VTGRARSGRRFGQAAAAGWEAALLEIEHQAVHWDTPDHGETGHLIASALRAAAEIARGGGLQCEHRRPGQPTPAPPGPAAAPSGSASSSSARSGRRKAERGPSVA